MPTITFYTLLLLSPVFCKPHYADLNEEEMQLYRAAYDSPNYDQDYIDEMGTGGYQQVPGDSIWMMKAKLKEVKEFMRTLSANLLSTKLKIKEMSQNLPHHHKHADTKKPPHSHMQYHHHAMAAPHYDAMQYGHEIDQDY